MNTSIQTTLDGMFQALNVCDASEKLRIYIIVQDVLRLHLEDRNSSWEYMHAILDNISEIEKKLGPFPGHTTHGVKGHAKWKDDFNLAYQGLAPVAVDEFLTYCGISAEERATILKENNIEAGLLKLYRRLQHRSKRSAPAVYAFSKEVMVYYTVSTLKTENTHRLTIYLKNAKGRIAEDSKVDARCQNESHYIDVINKKLLTNKKLRTAVTKQIVKSGDHFLLSLKSFWYINSDMLEKTLGYKHEIATQMFSTDASGDEIGNCTLNEINLPGCEAGMKRLFKTSPHFSAEEAQELAWRQLAIILREAYRQSQIKHSPLGGQIGPLLKEIRKKTSNEDLAARAVRDALIKKTLRTDEERNVYIEAKTALDKSFKRGTDGENARWDYLGVIIRLFTGLAPNEVCALTWGDYCIKKNPVVSYLKVSKSIDINTGASLPFPAKEKYRIVPVTSLLKSVLDESKTRALSMLTSTHGNVATKFDKALSELLDAQPIVPGKNDSNAPCKPRKLRDTTQQILKKCIPDAKAMDISYAQGNYRGDFLRSNFRYRGLNTCDMSLGEVQYLLGNQPPDTYSKHYCDYTNQFSQLALSIKLERWVSQLYDYSDFPQTLHISKRKSHTAKPFNAEKTAVHIQFDVPKSEPHTSSEIEITVQTNYGLEATAVLARSAEKDE